MSKVYKVFAKELQIIKNEEIRDFVVWVFGTMAPDYFWTVPASTSGKYHPEISKGKGGLVRHTKLAVWWGVELMKTDDYSPGTRDAVIAALLLHDLMKNGESLTSWGNPTLPNAVAMHGRYLADAIEAALSPPPANTWDSGWVLAILTGIRYHMGQWTGGAEELGWAVRWKGCVVSELVHLADYCASRKVDSKIQEIADGSL